MTVFSCCADPQIVGQPIAGKAIFEGALKCKQGFKGIGISHNHDPERTSISLR